MPKVFTSKTQKLGELGENLASRFLLRKGFKILERNYTRQCGEIDLITEKLGKIHFVEVKSVSYETGNLKHQNVTHETFIRPKTENTVRPANHNPGWIRPEENMHPKKLEKLYRTIAVYLSDKGQKDWQLDLLCVYIDKDNKTAKIKILENIVQ